MEKAERAEYFKAGSHFRHMRADTHCRIVGFAEHRFGTHDTVVVFQEGRRSRRNPPQYQFEREFDKTWRPHEAPEERLEILEYIDAKKRGDSPMQESK